jgi:mitochondrial chaperone BCS1
MNAVNQVARNSVLLFEDIDCTKSGGARVPSESGRGRAAISNRTQAAGQKENSADKNSVTLSGLLNVLDGFYAPTNVLFMMTTNRVETLDEALPRPGRIDCKLYLGKATGRQKIEPYEKFFPQASQSEAQEFVEINSAETMAEFQGLLLELEQEHENLELAVSGKK